MVTSNEFSVPDITHADGSTSLENLGPVELNHPTQDIDGDGTMDTATVESDEALIVMTDTDLDGYADHVTVVDDSGEFAAWEFRHDENGGVRWERTDHGNLG
ncbi:DUF6802 family protein [Antrihabitans stalactiti]|uniref:DUF6802 domain-containing protein n=1 Tax=Antrihabitans stalactiti TaxID=2584121 RepID=A0A848KA49_9NOCA|nr:DUF6802 family protein [Antrihabitans stalactiti]NMN95693.1 hypothetical protein [Antrihabitans stalactiti]